MESSDEEKLELEYSSNVSSTIMMKVPTACLVTLRNCFENESHGLNLIQFLNAFVQNMDLEDNEMLLKTVPDLVDLFCLVDVNGDEHMEWSEFVMFVIEQVVQDKDFTIFEKFDDVSHYGIQPPASRHPVQCSKILPELNRLFVGVGPDILIFSTNNQSETWLSEADTLVMQHKGKKAPSANSFGGFSSSLQNKEEKLGPNIADDVLHECIDIAFLPSKDMLFVLRSDLCVEFVRLASRTSFLPENMEHCGFWHLKNPHYRIQIRDIPEESWRLFTIGNASEIESWLISVGERGHVEISDPQLLMGHTDYVRDILIIHNESYSMLVSASMDKKVLIWDLKSLVCKGVKTGHTAGVQCLAYDGRSTLFAGGFDYSIIGWDLDAQISKPVIYLHGHQATVTKVRGFGNVDRCISLDNNGELRFWDTSRANPNDSERNISEMTCIEDHLRSFEVFADVGSRFPTSHGIFVAAQGRRQHTLRIADYADKVSPPLHVFLSSPLLMCITVHTHHITFWSAVTGHEQNIMKIGSTHQSGLSIEITSATLDDRGRKLIVGDSNGHISVYNGLTAAKLKVFPALPYAVRYLLYTPDKTIIAIAGAGDLHIFDELPPADSDKQLHLRETRAHEADVVAIAYSPKLGLIATADCSGCLVVWNYEFLSVEIILNGFIEGEIGQLAFLDPLPLLVVTGSTSILTIVPVSAALKQFGRVLWRVQMCVQGSPELEELVEKEVVEEVALEGTCDCNADTMTGLLGGDEMMANVEGAVGIGGSVIISEVSLAEPSITSARTPRAASVASSATSIASMASGKVSKKSTVANSTSTKSVTISASESKKLSVKTQTTEPVLEELGSPPKSPGKSSKEGDPTIVCSPLSRQASSMEAPSAAGAAAVGDSTSLLGDDSSVESMHDSNVEDGAEEDGNGSIASIKKLKLSFSKKRVKEYLQKRREARSMTVDIKSTSVVLTPQPEDIISITLKKILDEREQHRLAQLNILEYDREMNRKKMLEELKNGNTKPFSEDLSTVPLTALPKDIDIKIYIGYDDGTIATCDLTKTIQYLGIGMVPPSISAASRIGYNPRRTCIRTIKYSEINNFGWSAEDIETGSLPTVCSVVRVWHPHGGAVSSLSLVGENNDILTGSEDFSVQLWRNDSIFKGVLTRGREFDKLFRPRWKTPFNMVERAFKRKCNAEVLVKELRLSIRPKKRGKEKRRLAISQMREHRQSHTPVHESIPLPTIEDVNLQSNKEHKLTDDPDHIRAVGQLAGKVTYHVSHRDVAKTESLARFNEAKKSLQRSIGGIGEKAKKKKVTRKSLLLSKPVVEEEASEDSSDEENDGGKNPFNDPAYMAEIMSDAHTDGDSLHMSAAVIHNTNPHKFQVSASLMSAHRKRKIRTKYDLELAAMDTADPNNWEIQSTNRQRSLYQHLYSELDILGKTKDNNLVYEIKLNKLSPGGNFRTFISKIRRERLAAKNEILASVEVVREHKSIGDGEEKEIRKAILVKSPLRASMSGKTLSDMGGSDDDSIRQNGSDDDNSVGRVSHDGKEDMGEAVVLLPSEVLRASKKKSGDMESGKDGDAAALSLPPRGIATSPTRGQLKRGAVSSSSEAVTRRLSMSGTFASRLHELASSTSTTSSGILLKPSEILASSRKRGSTMIGGSGRPDSQASMLSKSTPALLPSAIANAASSSAFVRAASPSRIGSSNKATATLRKAGINETAKKRESQSTRTGSRGTMTESATSPSRRQTAAAPAGSAPSSPKRRKETAGEQDGDDLSVGSSDSFLPPILRGPRPEVVMIKPLFPPDRKVRDDGAELGVVGSQNQDQFTKIVEAAVTKFESAISTVDKFSKISHRESRRTIHQTLRNNPNADSRAVLTHIANELTTSALMLQNQKSMEGVLEITLKQKAAEKNWVRKVSMAMDDGFISSESNMPIVSMLKMPSDESISLRKGPLKKKSDVKVLAIKSFGPYPVEELLKFLRAFDSLPQITVRVNTRDGKADFKDKETSKDKDKLDETHSGAVINLLASLKEQLEPINENAREGSDDRDDEEDDNDDGTVGGVDANGEERSVRSQALSEDDWGDLDAILAAPALDPEMAMRKSSMSMPGIDSNDAISYMMKSLNIQYNTLEELSVSSIKRSSPTSGIASGGLGSPKTDRKRNSKHSKSTASITKKLRQLQEVSTSGIGGISSGITGNSSATPTSEHDAGESQDSKVETTIDGSSNRTSPSPIGGPRASSTNVLGPPPGSPSKPGSRGQSRSSATSAGSNGGADDGQAVTKVRLSELLRHKYMQRVPEWHNAIERLLSRKIQQQLHSATASGTPATASTESTTKSKLNSRHPPTISISKSPDHDDWASLHEILVDMCPHMNPIERSECLRFLTLKSQNDHAAQVEHKKREAEIAHQKALAARFSNLNSIFSFFDKGNTGKVMKFDILKVLQKTLANKARDAAAGEVSYTKFGGSSMGSEDEALARLIQRLDDGHNISWSFNEFVEIFENIFGY